MSLSGQITARQKTEGIYISKLQELCQRRGRPLPEYKTLNEGHLHGPKFKASVIANGVTFETSDSFKSAKEAQIEVAKIALSHFNSQTEEGKSHAPGAEVASSVSINGNKRPMSDEIRRPILEEKGQTSENTRNVRRNKHSGAELHMFKNQLQNVVLKKGYDLPTYTFERVGPPHDSRFKSKVTVNGQAYESPGFFGTLKDSENAAAKAALLSLVPPESQDAIFDKSVFKNILQELTQKSGLKIPVYNTSSSGASHMPAFVSTVVVDGETFYGEEAKTKKLAEMNAAEVAYNCLSQRENQSPSAKIPVFVSKDVSVSKVHVVNAPNLGVASKLDTPSKIISSQSDIELPKIQGGDQDAPKQIPSRDGISSNGSLGSPIIGKITTFSSPTCANSSEPLDYIPFSQEECSSLQTSPSVLRTSVPLSTPDIFYESSSSLRNVLRMSPRELNMDFPPGAVVQHSDDEWIHVRFPANHAGH